MGSMIEKRAKLVYAPLPAEWIEILARHNNGG